MHHLRTMRTSCLFPLLVLLAPATHAQLLNPGFESVTITGGDTLADDWYMESSFGAGVVDQAHAGEHAFGVWNWYYYGHGIARNGSTGRGTPVAEVPARLLGWYDRHRGELEEDQSPNDSAEVSVLLTRWNTMTGVRDTVAAGAAHLAEQGGWAPFQVDIGRWSSEAPDTLTIQLLSGVGCFCGGTTLGYCCYFYVDDLQLESAQGVREAVSMVAPVRVTVSDGDLNITTDPATPLPFELIVHDMTGRTVQRTTVHARGQQVRGPDAAGVYTFTAITGARVLGSGRFVQP